MKAFRSLRGRVAVLDRSDVDTDQIVAKQALSRIDRTGFGKFLFYDWRFDVDGKPRPEFELNSPACAGAKILLAGRNFGCGSSREHAPWALQDYGFEAIIAPSFGDIFRSNCVKIGLLPIVLDAAEVKRLMELVDSDQGSEMTVDLEANTITDPQGRVIPFEFDEFQRHCLLHGLDDIGRALQHEDEIAAYEASHPGSVVTTAL
jgi:3-isopropylmalate/(R)-2-methylmalate dehydratase small subunit